MRAEFNYELSKDEYIVGLSALMDQLGRQDSSRKPRLVEQLAAFVAVLALIMIVFPPALPGLLVATFLLAVLQALLRPRWLRGATGQSYDPAVAEHNVEIADKGLVVRSSLRERRWSWRAVRRIHDLKQAIVFELIGWDMIVLPDRLWDRREERDEFLANTRALAADAIPEAPPTKPASFDTLDLLTIGAIAAAVDALAIVVFTIPVHAAPGAPLSDASFVGAFTAILLLGLALAFLAFRIGKRELRRLHDRSPRVAIAISQGLVWAVPAYMLAYYFGVI